MALNTPTPRSAAPVAARPVYVLFGTDGFLRDQHRQEIIAAALGDADPQTCVSLYDSAAELSSVLDDLRTLPFLGDRRLVIVEDADDFVSAHREALEAYLNAPAATGSLLLIVKSFPRNTRLAKLVERVGLTFDCGAPKPSDVAAFVRRRATEAGRRIEPQAADLLVQWVGTDLARAAGEVEKLALYTEGRDAITADDVSAIVVATAGVNPFALTDALIAGDARAALEALEGTLTQRGEEFRVLGLIGWHLRRLLKAKHMQAAGARDFDILKAAGIFRQAQDPFRRLLARRGLMQVCDDFRQLIRADLAMKTGYDAKAALQRLVVSLCSS